MEYFEKAKVIRLKSAHSKYLWAEEDECGISQGKDGSKPNAKWEVEIGEDGNVIRLKSCYGCYLTATDVVFLLGMTGKKVIQTKPVKLDSSVEWQPIRDGFSVQFKTRYGNFLRGNGTVPPWRNSVTHNIPHISKTQDWTLWEVEIVEAIEPTPPPPIEEDEPIIKPDGRIIYYIAADDNKFEGNANTNWSQIIFKGHDLKALKERLRTETGIEEDIEICSYNQALNRVFPLRVQLPPNSMAMHLLVIRASSKRAQSLVEQTATPTFSGKDVEANEESI